VKTEDRLLVAVGLILAACTVVLTGMVLYREREARSRTPAGAVSPEDWRELTAGGHRVGDSTAANTVVVFSDYQCPGCRGFDLILDEIIREHPTSSHVIFRHYPLTAIHPWAEQAALASECAAAQGSFRRFHSMVFEKQDSLGLLSWREFATRSNVPDLVAFQECVQSGRYRSNLSGDRRLGDNLRVTRLPSLFVNGQRLREVPSRAVLQRLLVTEPPS